MLTILNRKELMVTLNLNRQSEVRRLLAQNGIDYLVKTTNLENANVVGSKRAHLGSFGMDSNYTYEYKFYVHKKDYERAKHLVELH